jgi:Arc/MetJ-type ribon-helix-helix transcriptional regulator
MKVRVSATIDKETETIIEFLMKTGKFRNKSHVIEDAIKILREAENDKKK